MKPALALLLLGCAGPACTSSGMVRGTSPSGKAMMRVTCPGGWDECRDAAERECKNQGFRSETSGDEERTLWFKCLPQVRGYLKATNDSEGRKAWADQCRSRADCLSDAMDVCPEGYVLANSSDSGRSLVFRCKGDTE